MCFRNKFPCVDGEAEDAASKEVGGTSPSWPVDAEVDPERLRVCILFIDPGYLFAE
jgi:hypothetical protein